MTYTRTTPGQQLADNALTKVVIYFKDGNARTFHGRHNASSYTPVDPRELELKRLKRYVDTVLTKVQMAILYDMKTGAEIARLREGQWV